MLFMRVYLDLTVECARQRMSVPPEWSQALDSCLAHAKPAEREHYLELIADSRTFAARLPAPLAAQSRSAVVEERMHFMQTYLEIAADSARRGEPVPLEWTQGMEVCLAHAQPEERAHYRELMADATLAATATAAPAQAVVAAPPPRPTLSSATREELDALLRVATLDEAIALTRDPRARLRPEHLEILVARAQKLAETGERRLVEALLARTPVRVQMAPLFLEATTKQRALILLAAQRAELGRILPPAAPKLDAETAGRLEFAAVAGERAEFGKLLAEALDVAPEVAWRIAEDRGGEALSLALTAIGAPRDLTVRIITALDMREGEAFPRIHAFAGLADKISPAAARRIVAAMAGASGARVATPPLARATARTAESPSPFLRRDPAERRARLTPETTARLALGSRKP